ncbi:E3 ubiquitin-protein ligase TRIM45 isoform X1 [Megachile rotundata]|uniref:E3 ubiquitin-protein ligase TRIM45 isoform X1 n=2 Tax=Megachile rotundata TaxID=143995 RepID=UPI000614CFA7|nr:PREDICTED: tripartite motif-containing protein 45-like isoform X1 [Megachile rotundata]
MDFIKCPKYQSVTSCCGENTSMDGENESNEFRNKNSAFHERNNKIENTYPVLHTGPVRFTKDERSNEYSNVFLPLGMDKTNSIYQSCELPYGVKYELNNECMQEETVSSLEVEGIQEFHCPRCGKGMQEPRLLPCLHPICSPCVLELISKHVRVHSTQSSNYYEICPLCDFQLPNANSPIPPPHYPLQHRLVMDAIRSGFANKVLCDACTDEITALVQCATCLRNFCLNCGMEHQQQITMELKPSKHSIKPLWEATRVRRTALCQKHPIHALRFYCIACQQVTCKECMWSMQHRGHASETATGAGKRVALYLKAVLQRAKTLLNILLTQYDQNMFLNSTLEEIKDIFASMDHRYVKLIT